MNICLFNRSVRLKFHYVSSNYSNLKIRYDLLKLYLHCLQLKILIGFHRKFMARRILLANNLRIIYVLIINESESSHYLSAFTNCNAPTRCIMFTWQLLEFLVLSVQIIRVD